jgi:murein DD-endopeptidase MepM/ murein hydrolase activator NlpD
MRAFIIAALVCLPLCRMRVNSPFGMRHHPLSGLRQFHEGVDLHARKDTVFAVLDGYATRVADDRGLGIHIILQHNAVETVYGHLSEVFITNGMAVVAGDPIGLTGATGRVTGEHLHFAVRFHSHYINPILFLKLLLAKKESSHNY